MNDRQDNYRSMEIPVLFPNGNNFPQYLNDDEGRFVLTGNTNVSEKEGLSLAPGADPNDPASYSGFLGHPGSLCLGGRFAPGELFPAA